MKEADKLVETLLEGKEPRIEAHGVKGMKSTQWRKTFKNSDALNAWAEKNDAQVHGTRVLTDNE